MASGQSIGLQLRDGNQQRIHKAGKAGKAGLLLEIARVGSDRAVEEEHAVAAANQQTTWVHLTLYNSTTRHIATIVSSA
jgi:hypothetical protein